MAEQKTSALATLKMGDGGFDLVTGQEAWAFADLIVANGMAPASLNTPGKIFVAFQCGAEIGMPPMRSLNSYYVVNGKAALYGDAPLSLVRASGELEYIKEWLDGEDGEWTAVCETKRRGEPEAFTSTFSVEDARTAGLWGKNAVWKQYPKRMLKMKARAFRLRDGFGDILCGNPIREDLIGTEPDETEMVQSRASVAGAMKTVASMVIEPESHDKPTATPIEHHEKTERAAAAPARMREQQPLRDADDLF